MKDLVTNVLLGAALTVLGVAILVGVGVMCVRDLVSCPEHLFRLHLQLDVAMVVCALGMMVLAALPVCHVWRSVRDGIAEIKARKSERASRACDTCDTPEMQGVPILRHQYHTNEPNLLGGYMTYDTLDAAWDAMSNGRATEIWCESIVTTPDQWHGRYTGRLEEVVSEGLVYKA